MAPLPSLMVAVAAAYSSSLAEYIHASQVQHQCLEKRDPTLETRGNRPGTIAASSLGAGILVAFCLIATSLALLVWWFFHIKGGFLWRNNDWDDYKSSVMRRPVSDDAITVFTDGSSRRGGGTSTAGARTVVLSEVWDDEEKLERAERMTDIGKGGRDIWGEFKQRMGFGLRGGQAPSDIMSEAGMTSVSRKSRMRGVCQVHHYGLEDLERAKNKAEELQKEKMRIKERERRERLLARQMAEAQGIPLDSAGRPKKSRKVRRDWDNRSLETTTTLTTSARFGGKDYAYEAYLQELPARPKGWKPGDSEVPDIRRGYDPQQYIKPKHLSHHLSTRTTHTEMSFMPGDDPGDVPPPITMKRRPARRESKKEKEREVPRRESKRERSHHHHQQQSRTKSTSKGKGESNKRYAPAATEPPSEAYYKAPTAPPRAHRPRREPSDKTEIMESTSESEDYTSSSEDYSTNSDEYTTDSEAEGAAGSSSKPELGTKVYHHPLQKRDVWREVIGAGEGPSGSGTGSAAGINRNSGASVAQSSRPRASVASTTTPTIRAIPPPPPAAKGHGGNRGSTETAISSKKALGFRRED